MCENYKSCDAYNGMNNWQRNQRCHDDTQWPRCQYNTHAFANNNGIYGTSEMHSNNAQYQTFVDKNRRADKRGSLVFVVVVIALILMGAGAISLSSIVADIRGFFTSLF